MGVDETGEKGLREVKYTYEQGAAQCAHQLGVLTNLDHEPELKAIILARYELVNKTATLQVDNHSHIVNLICYGGRLRAVDVIFLSGILAGFNATKTRRSSIDEFRMREVWSFNTPR
jgi:hypothetical protein